MRDSFQATKFGHVIASFRAADSPSKSEFACPFCRNNEVALLMGNVTFSASLAADDLYPPATVTLAALLCAKSHMFFVVEKDITATFESAAA